MYTVYEAWRSLCTLGQNASGKHGSNESTFAFDFSLTTIFHSTLTSSASLCPARMSTATPNLPALDPSTSYSFYPYPIRSTPTTSLRGLAPPTQNQAQAGPSTNRRAEITRATRIRERSERRALVGLRPAGFAIGRESEDLDLEEMTLEDERVSQLLLVICFFSKGLMG